MSVQKIAHFYHAYADGDWYEPVSEHAEALRVSGFPSRPIVGIVGSARARAEVRSYCESEMGCEEFIEADRGWEHLTLRAVRSHAVTNPDDVILYAHSKGAHHANPLNVALRRSLTRHLVTGWEACVTALSDNDVVSCHWLTPERYPEAPSPYFAGNYWWAIARHLARLPDVPKVDRYGAEQWVGLVRPERVVDLCPGWPTWGLFGREVAQVLNPTFDFGQ